VFCCPVLRRSRRGRTGYVTFDTEAAATAALAANETVVEGNPIRVEHEARVPPRARAAKRRAAAAGGGSGAAAAAAEDDAPPNPLRVFVGNLSRDVTEDTLKSLFASAGPISEVLLKRKGCVCPSVCTAVWLCTFMPCRGAVLHLFVCWQLCGAARGSLNVWRRAVITVPHRSSPPPFTFVPPHPVPMSPTRSFGFVTFTTLAAVTKALALSGTTVGDRAINVKNEERRVRTAAAGGGQGAAAGAGGPAKGRRAAGAAAGAGGAGAGRRRTSGSEDDGAKPLAEATVWVGNLPEGTTRADVEAAAGSVGPFLKIRFDARRGGFAL
jgi:RNA recognition motif-containing protein